MFTIAILLAAAGIGFAAGKRRPARTNLGRALQVQNSVHQLGEANYHVWILVSENGEVTAIRLTPKQYLAAKLSAQSSPEDAPPWRRD